MLSDAENKELFDAIATAKKECKDSYALSYLHAMHEAGILYGPQGVKTQILYALSNMATWRGEIARTTKKTLKTLLKKL